MKMIRNNESSVIFVATEQLLKRVLRDSADKQASGRWTVFDSETGNSADAAAELKSMERSPADIRAHQAKAAAEKAEAEVGEAKKAQASAASEGESGDKEPDPLQEIRNSLMDQVKATLAMPAKDAKTALIEIALENFGVQIDGRKSADTVRDDVVALIQGDAE